MVEMVCQEETVWMEREDHKENRDHLDLKDSKDLGVLESLTLGGERAPAPTLLEPNWSMMGELLEATIGIQEEQQSGCVCLMNQIILTDFDQHLLILTSPFTPTCMEQNITLTYRVHFKVCTITMYPVAFAMLPLERQ